MSYRKGFDFLPFKERIARKISTAITLSTTRLIVFLTPGYETPSGGVLSIVALYRESAALRHIHRARVALCTIPGNPTLLKYTWFENSDYILDVKSVLRRCRQLDYLLLHIPEGAINQVTEWLASDSGTLLRGIRDVHLNVMLQNIDAIEGQNIEGLKRFGKVTCTTGHEAYSNLSTREELGVPLHWLSVCIYRPEFFTRMNYEDKEPILVVSHDEHPLKEQVLGRVGQALPELSIQIVRNLSYEDYKKLISHAKWSLTFGEGLDGYFVESVLSGGIPFAVFNERFFTPAFAELETVYPSWDALRERMAADLERLDQPAAYNKCWRQAYDLVTRHYNIDEFQENLRKFYRGEYTFL